VSSHTSTRLLLIPSSSLVLSSLSSFFLMIRPPPSSTLFPYTTLFRSQPAGSPTLRNFTKNKNTSKPSTNPIARSRAIRVLPKPRSEEHTSELQSLTNLVCRLLLEKKKTIHRCYSTITKQRTHA